MNFNAVYFSPTGNTEKTIKAIEEGIGEKFKNYNITLKKNRDEKIKFTKNDLVILGCPVYVGRIPNIEDDLFKNIKGDNTPCVLVVNYGNREYEDALIELKNVALNKGFIPIAAGAFIGEHSYSREIATNRPDENDLKEITEFGKKIKNKINKELDLKKDLVVSGNYPYRDVPNSPKIAPSANEVCTECGKCIGVCPVDAIDKNNPKQTDANKCIKCFACVKICPVNAKDINAIPFKEKVESIKKICLSRKKEIEVFI